MVKIYYNDLELESYNTNLLKELKGFMKMPDLFIKKETEVKDLDWDIFEFTFNYNYRECLGKIYESIDKDKYYIFYIDIPQLSKVICFKGKFVKCFIEKQSNCYTVDVSRAYVMQIHIKISGSNKGLYKLIDRLKEEK